MAIIIKTTGQIEGIRKSSKLAADTLRMLDTEVKEGITTEKIDKLVDTYIRDHGAIPAPLNYMGYPKSVCTSLNEVVCHGIPDQTVLKEGDVINVDVTTILNGYFGDTCKMFAVGQISQEAHDLLDVTQGCLATGIEQVKPGNHFFQIGQAIQLFARNKGYSVVYQFCGHGVGLKFHEEPQISHDFGNNTSVELREMKENMIFTIEPMINQGVAEAVIDATDKWTARTVDGKLSAQYEHTILVTSNGSEVLTI
jgi:methionyl aminopeptidase